jgi:hypothetical protein
MDRRSTRACLSAPRVYCFISRFPFFKLHYNVLYSILARERLYTIESASGPLSEAMNPSSSSPSKSDSQLQNTNIMTSTEERDSSLTDSPKPSKRESDGPEVDKLSITIPNMRVPKVFSNDVINILKNYYSQIVPKAGEEINFTLPGELHSHSFHCPVLYPDVILTPSPLERR